jgi:hypothetical protein
LPKAALALYNAAMSLRAIEVVVGVDGNVAADDLARLGVRPGDHLRIVPVVVSTRRSFLGAFPRDVGFTQAHLDEIRHDMSIGLGEDIAG